jgi:uncharacterized damage-inducible protein DinB
MVPPPRAGSSGIVGDPSRTSHLRQAGRLSIVRLNVADVSHEDSLLQPRPAGNCLNWVLGHLLTVYNDVLPVLGQQPVVGGDVLQHYARGSAPMTDARDARLFAELQRDWDAACTRIDAGLAAMPGERLRESAPHSPTGNPDETVGSLLSTVMFHQAYHAGQLGILRRIAGKPGPIR